MLTKLITSLACRTGTYFILSSSRCQICTRLQEKLTSSTTQALRTNSTNKRPCYTKTEFCCSNILKLPEKTHSWGVKHLHQWGVKHVVDFNPIAWRMAKTESFGHSACYRVESLSASACLTRHYCTEKLTSEQTTSDYLDPLHPKNLTLVYQFPFIVHARLISRFKVYHTAFTFLLIPIFGYLNHTGVVSETMVYSTIGLFTLAGSMLYIISSIISRIVGRLYIDKNKETVMLSHLTFWSHRKDEVYKVTDIVPISDTDEDINDIYVKLKTYSGHQYYLTPRLGKILKKEEFKEVFGA